MPRHFAWISTYLIGTAVTSAGAVTTKLGWDGMTPAFPLGLTLLIIGALGSAVAAATQALRRPLREADEAFEQGLQMGESRGFREGRKVAPLRLVRDGRCAHCGHDAERSA